MKFFVSCIIISCVGTSGVLASCKSRRPSSSIGYPSYAVSSSSYPISIPLNSTTSPSYYATSTSISSQPTTSTSISSAPTESSSLATSTSSSDPGTTSSAVIITFSTTTESTSSIESTSSTTSSTTSSATSSTTSSTMSSTISSAPTATIVNGNFDDSSTSYSPWTAASSLNAYITTSNPHSAPNALAITYTVDSARSYLSVVQTLSTTAGLTAGTYTFTGYARSDMLYIGVYGCNSFYISCPGGTFVSYNQFVSGFKLVPNVYGMMSTTCTFSDAQIAAGPMVQLNGGNCGVGNYAFDDITITPA